MITLQDSSHCLPDLTENVDLTINRSGISITHCNDGKTSEVFIELYDGKLQVHITPKGFDAELDGHQETFEL